MSDTPPTPEERAEARATRRRWITLAEVLGIAAVVISGLTLWNNVSERQSTEAERKAATTKDAARSTAQARASAAVMLSGTPVRGGDALSLADRTHQIQRATMRFPPALGVPAKESLLSPVIEADWFAGPVLALTDGGADMIEGRIPVTIEATYWEGGRKRRDAATYDLVFRTEGRMLRGRRLELRGLVLRERPGAGAARLDALWARERQAMAAARR